MCKYFRRKIYLSRKFIFKNHYRSPKCLETKHYRSPQILLRVFVLFRSAFLRWLLYPLNYGKTVLATNHITFILTIAGV